MASRESAVNDSSWIIDANKNRIHKSAIVGPSTVLGRANSIGPLSVVGGLGCPVIIGDETSIGAGCVIGSPAEFATGYPGIAHLNFEEFAESDSSSIFGVRIGSRSIIRDAVRIHSGKSLDTTIGDLNYLHSGTHIDHDVQTDIGVVFAPGVISAGDVNFGAFCQVGLGTAIHQRTSVGTLSMIGMNSTVKGEVPPLSMHFGSPSRVQGVNGVRLQRLGLSAKEISELDELFRTRPFDEVVQLWDLNKKLVELVQRSVELAHAAWSGYTTD